MASSSFTSFTHSPLCPSLPRPNPAVVASAAGLPLPVKGPSLYGVLEIPMTASCQEIKAAYRKLARTYHPDVVAKNSAEKFIKIQAAYSTLSDPIKRADYDREIYKARLVSVSGLSSRTAASGYSGYYTRRNWESDQCW